MIQFLAATVEVISEAGGVPHRKVALTIFIFLICNSWYLLWPYVFSRGPQVDSGSGRFQPLMDYEVVWGAYTT